MTPGGCPGGQTKVFFLIIFQLIKINLFCDKTFIVRLILGHFKPKMMKNGILKVRGSRNWRLGGWGVKKFFWQQHNHNEKMCANFGGFSLVTFGDN